MAYFYISFPRTVDGDGHGRREGALLEGGNEENQVEHSSTLTEVNTIFKLISKHPRVTLLISFVSVVVVAGVCVAVTLTATANQQATSMEHQPPNITSPTCHQMPARRIILLGGNRTKTSNRTVQVPGLCDCLEQALNLPQLPLELASHMAAATDSDWLTPNFVLVGGGTNHEDDYDGTTLYYWEINSSSGFKTFQHKFKKARKQPCVTVTSDEVIVRGGLSRDPNTPCLLSEEILDLHNLHKGWTLRPVEVTNQASLCVNKVFICTDPVIVSIPCF